MSITPQNNTDLNQGILYLWSQFGGPSLKGWWVISRTSSKWGEFWIWSYIWLWRSESITSKTIEILNKVFYTYGLNLVILARKSDELSQGQTCWRTEGWTDGQKQATTIPGGQNWSRVKMAPKWGKSKYHDQNEHSCTSVRDTSSSHILGHSASGISIKYLATYWDRQMEGLIAGWKVIGLVGPAK